MKKRLRKALFISMGSALFLALSFALALGISVRALLNPAMPEENSERERERLAEILDGRYPERTAAIWPLSYEHGLALPEIAAKSAVAIDVETGSILFEKNPDSVIPPASMTKLVEMYVVLEAASRGEVSLDDAVPLPPASWSVNLPEDASRMFLGAGQTVTLRELLLGLSIASGNDASIAVANYVSGSMEDFVSRMNAVIKSMGLSSTVFVESSGYSEKNLTTAKEFAAFSRNYLARFPNSLEEFHSQRILRYPLEKNLPASQKRMGNSLAVAQENTSKLLDVLEGCDGLKTGFIYESGFNLALTAKRGNRRFLSITMGGPGASTAEGNRYRVADGRAIMEFCFGNFAPYEMPDDAGRGYCVGMAGARQSSAALAPAWKGKFSVPISARDARDKVSVTAYIPRFVYGGRPAGHQIGFLRFSLGDKVLQEIPLVTQREIQDAGPLGRAWGRLVYKAALISQVR